MEEKEIASIEYEKIFFDSIMVNYWKYIKKLNSNYICFENNMGFIFYIVPENNNKFKLILKKEDNSTFYLFSEKIVPKQHIEYQIINLVNSLIMYCLIYYNLIYLYKILLFVP